MRKFCLNEVVKPIVSEWQGKVLNPGDFRAHVHGVFGDSNLVKSKHAMYR